MKYRKKSSSYSQAENAVVLLGRLPKWISEQKTVQVFIKSQEFVITSLPSSPAYNEYRSMNSFCGKNFVELPNQDLVDGKRLTRSTGGSVKVDFTAKLPDDRNKRCKILGACSYPFLGFELSHHAIHLLNSEAFQCLSRVEENMDFVLSMVISEAQCSDVECKECSSRFDAHKPITSSVRGRPRKKQKSNITEIKCKSEVNSSTGNGLLRRGKAECGNAFCRLGCMCDSLKWKRKRTHCAHAECMFSKHCLIGPNFTPNGSSRLTLLSATVTSPENEGASMKRQRRPPKRWLEEEEELDIIAEVKRKSKLFVFKSPPKSPPQSNKDPEGGEGSSSLNDETNLPGGNNTNLETDSMEPHDNESTFKPKRPICVAIKSISGKQRFKSSLFRYSVPDERSKNSVSREINANEESSSRGHSSQQDVVSCKHDSSNDSSNRAIISRKYFRNYKEYRKFLISAEVTESQIADVCSSSLSPLQVSSILLMRWNVFEEKVRERSAFIWISQAPKCVVKVMVTDSDNPPDPISINLGRVENVCGFPSSVEYFFQLYKNHPERYGCCILFCNGLYWEVKGNLNSKAKVAERILFKVMRSCTRGSKELTFANSGKKILICDSLSVNYTDESLGDNYVSEDAVVESEINEIPEPDIKLYDSTAANPDKNSRKSHPLEQSAQSDGNTTYPPGNTSLTQPSDDSSHASEETRSGSSDNALSETSYEVEVLSKGSQSKRSIIPAPMPKGFLELSWYCLNLDRSFDKIIIDKPNFSANYTQMVYALRVSKERNIAVRISCAGGSDYVFNEQIWKQGVYADYMISDISVKVGPYYNYEVPEIRAFVKVNGILIRTHVELSKEPLTPETMPRVTRKDNRAAANKAVEPSAPIAQEPSVLIPPSSGGGMSESSSSSQRVEPLSSAPVPVPSSRMIEASALNRMVEPSSSDVSASVGKRTVMDNSQVASCTVNESLAQADTISEATPLPSATIESEPSEDIHSDLSDSLRSDFSIRIESVRGNWSGFDDIVNALPNNVISSNDIVPTKLTGSQGPLVNPLSNTSGATARVVAPSSVNSAVVKEVNPSSKIDSAPEVAPKSVESTGVRHLIPLWDTLVEMKSNAVITKSVDSIRIRDMNQLTGTSVANRTYSIATKFGDSQGVCQVNPSLESIIAARPNTVNANSVASTVFCKLNSSSDTLTAKRASVNVNSVASPIVCQKNPSSDTLVAKIASTVDANSVASPLVCQENPSSDTVVAKIASTVDMNSVASPLACQVNPSSDTLIAKRTNSTATTSIESSGVCIVDPLSDTNGAASVATKSIESTDRELNPMSGTSIAKRAASVATKSMDLTVHESDTSFVRRARSRAKKPRGSIGRKLNPLISRRAKSGAKRSVDPLVREAIWDTSIDATPKAADSDHAPGSPEIKGFLVPEIPHLKAVAVTKGGKSPRDAKIVTFSDPSWHINGSPLAFRCEHDAFAYLNAVIKVKMYPDSYFLKWTFVESKRFFRLNEGEDLLDIRNLTDDYFITSKGAFKYDDVCTDNLAEYGLDRDDNRRLLEMRRRREIRAAKNELINLLPSPMKTDVLMKVIYRSWSLIHSLEEKGRALCETLVTENTRKGFLLAKLRKMCSGEAMYKIFEELEQISRPRVDAALEYVAPCPVSSPKKRKAPQSRRPRFTKRRLGNSGGDLDSDDEVMDPDFVPQPDTRDGKSVASSSRAPRKPSKPVPPAVVDKPVKTIKVLKPVLRPDPVYSLTEPSSSLEESITMVPAAEILDEPPVEIFKEPPVKMLNDPPVKMLNEPPAKVLREPPVKILKEQLKSRKLFSGRYVSAATKRSLRKYNYIIPCLARKHHSLLKKSLAATVDGETPAQLTPLYPPFTPPSQFSKVILGEQEETNEKVFCEKIGTSSDDIAHDYEENERACAESDPTDCGTQSMEFEESVLPDVFPSQDVPTIVVKQEKEEYVEEPNELVQEDLEALSSEESDIDVG